LNTIITGENMRKCVIILLCLLVGLFAGELAQAQLICQNHFEQGFVDWTHTDATLLKDPAGGTYGHLESSSKGQIQSISSPVYIFKGKKFLHIKLRYRSSVLSSNMHMGSWALISFMDDHGKGVGMDGVVCKLSSDWITVEQRLTIPVNATQLSFQLRLQNATGYVDWDDVELSFVNQLQEKQLEQTATAAPDLINKRSEQELARFELKRDGSGQWVLDDGKIRLPNIVNVKSDEKYPLLGFRLPEEYCGDPKLIYDIQIRFTPNWSSQGNGRHCLFQVGHNVLGAEPNSASAWVWGGNKLLCRLTSGQSKGRYANMMMNDLEIRPGQTYSNRTRFSGSMLQAFWEGQFINTNKLLGSMNWPKEKPIYIGGESPGVGRLDATIESFTLRVLAPKIQAVLHGGEEWGYFIGNKPQLTALDFPNNDGTNCTSKFSIVDINKQVLVENQPTTITSGKSHRIEIPMLKSGWYRLDMQVKKDDAVLDISRPFVCLTNELQREPALDSPFGVMQQVALKPGQYDSRHMELVFAMCKKAGIRWWRLWMEWDDIQQQKGQYNWKAIDNVVELAKKYGIELYICFLGGDQPWQNIRSTLSEPIPYFMMTYTHCMPLNLDDWATYLTAFAKRYKGQIKYYQVWNESDARNGFYPFDTGKYVELLKVSSKALRDVDPEVKIGISGFCAAYARLDQYTHTTRDSAWALPEFYSFKPQDYFDILDFHFYSMSSSMQRWEPMVPKVQKLHDYLATQSEGRKPMWNSETSFIASEEGTIAFQWASADPITLQEQAARLVQFYSLSLANGIERNFWYMAQGDNGFINDDFSPKPAFAAHAVLADKIKGMHFRNAPSLNENLRICQFVNENKTRYLGILWGMSGQELISCSGETTDVSLAVYDAFGNLIGSKGKETVILAQDMPVYVEASSPIQFSPIVEVQFAQTPSVDEPLSIRCLVRNPSDHPSICNVIATLGSHQALPGKFVVPAHSKTTKDIVISPASNGLLRLDTILTGGINQRSLIQRDVRLMTVVLLKPYEQKSFQINKQEQVVIGAQTMDDQNRVLSESKWKGTSDLSASIVLKREQNRLAFEIQVTDDKVMSAAEKSSIYEGDAVELFIDLQQSGQSDLSKVIQISCSPDGRLWVPSDRQLPGLIINATPTPNGYLVTGGFTIDTKRLSEIGFDVAIDDADDTSGRKVQMVWVGNQDNFKNAGQFAKIRMLQ
jgi:hypothetical protein